MNDKFRRPECVLMCNFFLLSVSLLKAPVDNSVYSQSLMFLSFCLWSFAEKVGGVHELLTLCNPCWIDAFFFLNSQKYQKLRWERMVDCLWDKAQTFAINNIYILIYCQWGGARSVCDQKRWLIACQVKLGSIAIQSLRGRHRFWWWRPINLQRE